MRQVVPVHQDLTVQDLLHICSDSMELTFQDPVLHRPMAVRQYLFQIYCLGMLSVIQGM